MRPHSARAVGATAPTLRVRPERNYVAQPNIAYRPPQALGHLAQRGDANVGLRQAPCRADIDDVPPDDVVHLPEPVIGGRRDDDRVGMLVGVLAVGALILHHEPVPGLTRRMS